MNMPAYLKDKGIVDPSIAVIALSLIGLFNILIVLRRQIGRTVPETLFALIDLSFSRSIVALFILAPLSSYSVYVFAAAMGFVMVVHRALTNGVIAGIFGVKYLSMLSGFVFFAPTRAASSAPGSVVTCTPKWQLRCSLLIVIGLGLFATVINLPIDESAIERTPQSPLWPAKAKASQQEFNNACSQILQVADSLVRPSGLPPHSLYGNYFQSGFVMDLATSMCFVD